MLRIGGLLRKPAIALWSLPILLVIAAAVFIQLDAKWRKQARNDAANAGVKEAVTQAAAWLNKGDQKSGAIVEQRLMAALAVNDVSEKGDGDAVLDQVRTRRAELAADSMFDSAKNKLDAKAITDAIPLLRQYAADPHATKKAEAQKLLTECDAATSETAALQTLIEMSDEQFQLVTNSGKLDDGKVTHPVLVLLRNELIRRNIENAAQRRDALRLAEERRREAERIAAIQRQQAEELRIKAEKEREHNEREAQLAKERNPPAVSFKDLVNFPERYRGKLVKLTSVWFHGDLRRDKSFGVFTVGVSSEDGKYISQFLSRDKLTFDVSDTFGGFLDQISKADAKTKTNLCCWITTLGEYPVARIYRIERLNNDGEVVEAYDEK